MSKETWTDKLRKKMQSHEETPPDGLWDELSTSLHSVVPHKNRAFIYRRWAAAAAVAALLTGGGLYWWQENGSNRASDPMEQTATLAQKTTDDSQVKGVEQTPASADDENVLLAQNMPTASKPTASVRHASAIAMPDATSGASLAVLKEELPEAGKEEISRVVDRKFETPLVETGSPKVETVQEPAAPVSSPIDEEQAILAQLGVPEEGTAKAGNERGVNLFASNSLYGSDMFGPGSHPNMYRSAAQVRRESHHEQPLSFGLTFSLPLSSRFSIATGAVYTRQRSDFTFITKTSQTKEKQTLHYLGVPVSVMGSLWGNGRFHTYAQAGLQADFNVSAKTESAGVTRSSEKDDVQFSALAGLGAQYDLLPFLGVYLEPSARYYFDNQSDVSNSFKEHPFKFNLQMGLRFLLKNKK